MALIKIKVIAGEMADKVVWNHESEIMMLSITYKTVDGLANKHITSYLSSILEIPKGKINVIKGNDAAYKIIEVDNELSTIRAKLIKLNIINNDNI